MKSNRTNKPSGNLTKIKKTVSEWLIILPMVIVLYLMIWRPTVMGSVWSFFKMKGYTPQEFIGLRNFVEVIKDTQFPMILSNTVQYVLWSLVIGFLPPVIVAVILNEMVYFKNGFKTLIYLPAVVPGVAAMLMWYYIYYPDQGGLLNMLLVKLGMEPYGWLADGRFTILYIIISMTWKGMPGTMLLYYSAVQSVSTDLYEAAVIDGAGIMQRAWNVTRPQLAGILLLNLVSQIIGVFQVMEQPLTMTGGGPNGASISLGYQLYRYGFVTNRVGHSMALGVIMFIIMIILTACYFAINKKVEENI